MQQRDSVRDFLPGLSPSGPLNIELELDQVEVIIRDVIPTYSKDKELVEMASQFCRSKNRSKWSGDDFDEIVSMMNSFFDCAPSLPPSLVAFVHTSIGLIRHKQHEYTCAIESFLKALWLMSAAQEPSEQIGVALHRLSMAYGRIGENRQAQKLLEQALINYDRASLSKSHASVIAASERLQRYAPQNMSQAAARPRLSLTLSSLEFGSHHLTLTSDSSCMF
jgi:tetratricopeptide (TPR) repeat protein